MKKRLLKWSLPIVLCFIGSSLLAQDIQYSQFYANTLAMNPAFAGATQNTRFFAGTRSQWYKLPGTYRTFAFSADHYLKKINSGLGLLASYDQESSTQNMTVNTFTIGLQYAYQFNITDKLVYRHGIEAGYGSKNLDMSSLTFNNQFTNNGFAGGNTNEAVQSQKATYADISTGGLLFSPKIWLAVSLHHLNRPDMTFYNNGANRLPQRFTLTGGYKWLLRKGTDANSRQQNSNREQSITAAMLYKAQGKSDQLDLGAYYKYHFLIAGVWYRGIPVKVTKPEKMNNDALVLLVGLVYKDLWIGYSYDQTVSKLNNGIKVNSHELTVTYSFAYNQAKRPFKHILNCPEF